MKFYVCTEQKDDWKSEYCDKGSWDLRLINLERSTSVRYV